MFTVKCPVPHDGFPLSRGAYSYNRNMTDRERVQSVQTGADMAVPLFSVFLGGAVFWAPLKIGFRRLFASGQSPTGKIFGGYLQVAMLKSSCIGLLAHTL